MHFANGQLVKELTGLWTEAMNFEPWECVVCYLWLIIE